MSTEITKSEHAETLVERLFKVGAHFGFTKRRRHPTVAPYLFANKQGTDIFDLEKTSKLLESAKEVLSEAGKAGKTIMFVGTKEEISSLVRNVAESAGVPYVSNRWIGGMLTNFSEIKKRLHRLNELTEQEATGELERKYTKKERVMIGREQAKLTFNFGGVKNIERIPQLLVVVDPRHNSIAVAEAREMNVPVIGITSSDANLRLITHPVLVNDSLQSSVSFVLDELKRAYEAGKKEYTPVKQEEGRKRTHRSA